MKEIKPVHLGDSGPKVSNLQKGLLFLLFHQPGISHNNRKSLQQRLAPDVRTQTCGNATAELLGYGSINSRTGQTTCLLSLSR